jgi:hypothetical protein
MFLRSIIPANPFQVVFLAGMILCSLAALTLAQDPMRVETNQVAVPAMVFDKERYRLLWNDPTNLRRAFTEGNLTALDFQVFEDGKEQSIQNVKYEQTSYWVFHDNKGYHSELLGEGGRKMEQP